MNSGSSRAFLRLIQLCLQFSALCVVPNLTRGAICVVSRRRVYFVRASRELERIFLSSGSIAASPRFHSACIFRSGPVVPDDHGAPVRRRVGRPSRVEVHLEGTVLARAIFKEGCKAVAAGMNPMDHTCSELFVQCNACHPVIQRTPISV